MTDTNSDNGFKLISKVVVTATIGLFFSAIAAGVYLVPKLEESNKNLNEKLSRIELLFQNHLTEINTFYAKKDYVYQLIDLTVSPIRDDVKTLKNRPRL